MKLGVGRTAQVEPGAQVDVLRDILYRLDGRVSGLSSRRDMTCNNWTSGTDGRCCTNRHEPARCPPTGSSPADAIRHWSAEGGHPIQDLTAEDGLTPLPNWTPGAKAIADDGLVAEERVLHPALTMVP